MTLCISVQNKWQLKYKNKQNISIYIETNFTQNHNTFTCMWSAKNLENISDLNICAK